MLEELIYLFIIAASAHFLHLLAVLHQCNGLSELWDSEQKKISEWDIGKKLQTYLNGLLNDFTFNLRGTFTVYKSLSESLEDLDFAWSSSVGVDQRIYQAIRSAFNLKAFNFKLIGSVHYLCAT